MSKYYKRLPKESFQFDGRSVSWPDHKTSFNGWPKHTSKRRVKKFRKYEVHNEELFELLFGEVENFKRIPMQIQSWTYTINNEETFQSENSEWKKTMKPRWRAFMSARLSESK